MGAVTNSVLIIQFWRAKCKNKNAKLAVYSVADLQTAEILCLKHFRFLTSRIRYHASKVELS